MKQLKNITIACRDKIKIPDEVKKLIESKSYYIRINNVYSAKELEAELSNLIKNKSFDLEYGGDYEDSYSLDYLKSVNIVELNQSENNSADCNNAKELTEEITISKNLKELYVKSANFKEIPKWLFDLYNIEKLFINCDSLEELPKEIGK